MPKPRLALKDALILVSAYHSALLHRIGGSDTLDNKREFFGKQVLAHHAKRNFTHSRLALSVTRTPSIVDSTYQATKWFNPADWTRKFDVDFQAGFIFGP